MNVNIKLNKNFTTAFNKMQDTYGEELSKINGFADGQLSYTDFIDNFVDTETVADASVDGNANVGQKDIVTLINEMPKPHQKLLAYNKIYYEINKKYGFKIANKWLEKEWDGHLYLHDANTTSFVHYCVLPQECCLYLLDGKQIYASFNQIYNLLKEEEIFDEDKILYYKKPKNLKVQDLNGFTKVNYISHKETEKDFYYTKVKNGLDLITTEDHRFITKNGEKEAQNLSNEDILFSTFNKEIFTNSLLEYEGLELTSDLGWIIGMYLAEGYNQKGQLTICQSKTASPKEYEKIIKTLINIGIPFTEYEDKGIRLKNGDNNWERKILKIAQGNLCDNKCLTPDFIHFNEEFLIGLLNGIIDGDGTIAENRTCMIRLTSRTLINQIKLIGLKYDIYFSGNKPYIQSQKAKIRQKRPMYSANVNMNCNKEFFLSLNNRKINEKYTHFDYDKRFATNYEPKIGEMQIKNAEKTYHSSEEVFDLTTETHTFICNGIQIHNCFAYDLKDLAERGLFFIENFNSEPPKHLGTFVDFIKEFVSYACNRSSGAVGLPNLIPYMYYFWDKDIKNGYYTISPEKYAEQQIQRLIYALNQPFLRGGIQSAFTNTSVFDHPYLEALFGGSEFPDGSFMIDEIEGIMEFQKIYLETMSKIRAKNMMTFPVNTISLLKQNGRFIDEDFAIYAIKHNMKWNDSNIFADSSVNSLSNCCRLKSNIEDLGYFNSIGGTALKVGSVKVSTINLARLALENRTEKDYLVALKDLVELDLMALDRVRHIIKRNVEKGLLKNFSLGLVDFEHLYNTVGFIGIYETMKTFGYTQKDKFGNTFYTEEAEKFGKKIFEVIHNVKNTFILDKDYMVNTEQIPKYHWGYVA